MVEALVASSAFLLQQTYSQKKHFSAHDPLLTFPLECRCTFLGLRGHKIGDYRMIARLVAYLVVGSLASMTVMASPSLADAPKDGDIVEFQSDQFVSKFWKIRNSGKEFEFTQVKATFHKPEGDGPFPAIIFLHGCGGLFDNIRRWEPWFIEQGYVTLAPDSFKPRGYSTTCDDFEKVTQKERVDDVYGAIKYLETLPFVDTNRTLVMGFSNGGVTSLTAVQEAQAHKLNSIKGKVIGSLSIYPGCKVATPPFFAPVLVIVGSDDEWAPPIHCERMKAMPNSQPLVVKVYPGVHHNFDYVNLDTVKFGKRSRSDPAAFEQAKLDIRQFMSEYIK